MNTQIGFEKCVSFITSQLPLDHSATAAAAERTPRFAITISRQSGSGAHAVAAQLAEYMQLHAPRAPLPWMVFDRNLVEQVLEDHHLPQYLHRVMPEDRVSDLTDMLHQMFGIHPPFWTLVHQTDETMLRLAQQGSVILIGRGANLVTRKLPHTFHVRLVAPLEKRIAHTREIHGLERKAALEKIQREDRGRQRYVQKYFSQDLEDPLLYDLVLNTETVPYHEAAALIGNAALHRIHEESTRRAKIQLTEELHPDAYLVERA
ncbi:MAG TPA: cytidylate kinase-like family protein [Candidatus Angelobacter sp.]|nr:cytidylate kinase-like family protein [Candidatus Angelobacter sp.]